MRVVEGSSIGNRFGGRVIGFGAVLSEVAVEVGRGFADGFGVCG